MKSIGIVGYSNNSGLGIMISSLISQNLVNSQMVIKHPIKGTNSPDCNHTFADQVPTIDQFKNYVEACKPSTIIFIETPFNFEFFNEAKKSNIRVIVIPMVDSVGIDKFAAYEKFIDVFLLPTEWSYNLYRSKYPEKSVFIPWPVDTELFSPEKLPPTKTHTFLHNQGFGGAGYRKGTDIVYAAFKQLASNKSKASLWINSQPNEEQHSQLQQDIPNVHIQIEDYVNPVQIYEKALTYVCPSRREGLGLPIREAMSCGLHVITTDFPPMNELFDKKIQTNSLVQPYNTWKLPYGDSVVVEPKVYDLMLKMKWAVENEDTVKEIGKRNREYVENVLSWKVLRARFEEILCN